MDRAGGPDGGGTVVVEVSRLAVLMTSLMVTSRWTRLSLMLYANSESPSHLEVADFEVPASHVEGSNEKTVSPSDFGLKASRVQPIVPCWASRLGCFT